MTMSDEDTCAVCGDPRSSEKNQIIYCDGRDCNMPVHQDCYGISKIPEGDWYCDRCNVTRFNKRVNIICCPSQVGALKRIKNTNEFMHVVCAKLNKNVDCSMEPYLWKRSTESTETCYICNKKFGLCIQCDNFDCTRHFHVTCGINAGVITLSRSLPMLGPHFCIQHIPSMRQLSSGSSSSSSASSSYNTKPPSSTPTSSMFIPAKRSIKPKQQFIRQVAHLNNDPHSVEDDLLLSTPHSWKAANKRPKTSGSESRPQQQQPIPSRLNMPHANSTGSIPTLKKTNTGGAGPSTGSSSSIHHSPVCFKLPSKQQHPPSSSIPSNTLRLSPPSSTRRTPSPASSPPTANASIMPSTPPDLQKAHEELQRENKLLKQQLDAEKKKNQQLAQQVLQTSERQNRLDEMTSQLERLNVELEEYKDLKRKVTDIFMELNIATTNGTYPTTDRIKNYIDILHETIRRTRLPDNEEWSQITRFATNLANSKSTNSSSTSGMPRP